MAESGLRSLAIVNAQSRYSPLALALRIALGSRSEDRSRLSAHGHSLSVTR